MRMAYAIVLAICFLNLTYLYPLGFFLSFFAGVALIAYMIRRHLSWHLLMTWVVVFSSVQGLFFLYEILLYAIISPTKLYLLQEYTISLFVRFATSFVWGVFSYHLHSRIQYDEGVLC